MTAPFPSKEPGPAAFSTGTYNRTVSSQALPLHGILPLPREAVLDNGLQVRIVESHTASLVSVWCWYRVGSKDEPPGLTRASHWVEHMNFKGTAGIPADDFKQFIDNDRTLSGLVDAVTVEAVADAARRTLRPEQAAIVIAGPYEES